MKKLSGIKHIYFVGIGGVSMSGLAEIAGSYGYAVSGSDRDESVTVAGLRKKGVTVFLGHHGENITKDIDLVVYTAAIPADNPELLGAKTLGIKTMERAEFLGILMEAYQQPICVAGTHGKTTTSSMIADTLVNLGTNPTVSVGGFLSSIGGNFQLGTDKYFVIESCEYKNSFLKFNPFVGIVLNIDHDHTDFYENLEQLEESFKKFVGNIHKDGVLIINKDIVMENVHCDVITFSVKDATADFFATDVKEVNGGTSFTLNYKEGRIENAFVTLPGSHNLENALANFATIHALGLDLKEAVEVFKSFKSPNRRFQLKGKYNGATIIDDYAHHPTEIKQTLQALRKAYEGKIYCVFQPHTYSRTFSFLDDFADSFGEVDMVILLDIYSAREIDTGIVSTRDLESKIVSKGKETKYFPSFDEVQKFIAQNIKENDLLITMGAGDVYLIGDNLLKG